MGFGFIRQHFAQPKERVLPSYGQRVFVLVLLPSPSSWSTYLLSFSCRPFRLTNEVVVDFLVTAPRRGWGDVGSTTLETTTLTDTALGGLVYLGCSTGLVDLRSLSRLCSRSLFGFFGGCFFGGCFVSCSLCYSVSPSGFLLSSLSYLLLLMNLHLLSPSTLTPTRSKKQGTRRRR